MMLLAAMEGVPIKFPFERFKARARLTRRSLRRRNCERSAVRRGAGRLDRFGREHGRPFAAREARQMTRNFVVYEHRAPVIETA